MIKDGDKLDKRIIIPVTEEQRNRWQEAVPHTIYGSLAEFIRDMIDGVVEVINDDTKEVLVVVNSIEDGIIEVDETV